MPRSKTKKNSKSNSSKAKTVNLLQAGNILYAFRHVDYPSAVCLAWLVDARKLQKCKSFSTVLFLARKFSYKSSNKHAKCINKSYMLFNVGLVKLFMPLLLCH